MGSSLWWAQNVGAAFTWSSNHRKLFSFDLTTLKLSIAVVARSVSPSRAWCNSLEAAWYNMPQSLHGSACSYDVTPFSAARHDRIWQYPCWKQCPWCWEHVRKFLSYQDVGAFLCFWAKVHYLFRAWYMPLQVESHALHGGCEGADCIFFRTLTLKFNFSYFNSDV